LQRSTKRKQLKRKLPILLAFSGAAIALIIIISYTGIQLSNAGSRTAQNPQQPEKKVDPPSQKLSRKDLTLFLDDAMIDPSTLTDQFDHNKDGVGYIIKTTINLKLQNYIFRLLKRSRTRQSAVVVLNPYDGRVFAMVDHDADGNGDNLILKADYPAASLFKIVSAAAALEKASFTPDKNLLYKGSKHTLYRYQLKPPKGRYIQKTTFRKAFATSNNAVFGKLGIYNLGQDVLTEYANKFLFNKPITFDFPLAVSTIEVPADDFGLAEISSGFNKKTLISPLHATLLAAVAANRGVMPAPWLVDTIEDNTGKIFYQASKEILNSAISNKTAAQLKALMQDAVRYGTGRGAFGKLRRKKMFKKFELGAKTGTINDELDRYKYDWLTAYALDPDGTKGICVGVLGVHGKILGVRSTELARSIVNYYFSL
ncbi:MAG: hypothetical protein KJP06_03015, partial [Deltaproteobacteria bacterium]|nr:hypothetical protein [Deltaproteobacteria bacterium]